VTTAPLIEIPDRFNAASFFVDRHVVEGRGDKVAFFHEDRTVTYAGLQELVNRVGNALREWGCEPGDRILIVLPDSLEFIAAFFGAAKIGAIAVPVNSIARAADYDYWLADSGARFGPGGK